MTRAIAMLLAALTLAISTAPAFAHGEEVHAEASEEQPVAISEDAPATATADTPERISHDSSEPEDAGILTVLKNLHPATVHFPVALFILAGLAELALALRPSDRLHAASPVLVAGGAAGAILAAVVGWIHTGIWFGGDASMQTHRWLGTGLAVAGVPAAIVAFRTADNRISLRILLVLIAVAIALQGYLGGELAHGEGHLFNH